MNEAELVRREIGGIISTEYCRMKGDVEGLPLHLQLPPALRQGRAGDPYAILRPALKDLALIDSMRILSAIDEAIWRVDIITALDQITRNVKVMATFLGSSLVDLVDRHQQVVGTLTDLKERSEIIDKLTSFQLMETYYKGPLTSYKSFDLSGLDITSIPSMSEPPEDDTTEEVDSEDWQNVPWGPARIELVPSVTQSSTDTIAQIKRRMKAEEEAARRGIVPKTADDDDDDDDDLGSLKSSKSRMNLLDSGSGEGSGEGSEEEMRMVPDPMSKVVDKVKVDNGDIDDGPAFEYVQKIDEIASSDALESKEFLIDASRGSLTRTVSQPWAEIQDRGISLHSQIDELLKAKTVRMGVRLVQDQLMMLVRNILRAFRLNPVAINTVVESKQRTDPAQEFIVLLKDLRQVLLRRLLTTPDEEKTKAEYMAEVERRTEGYEKLRQRLDSEIQKVNRDRENKVSVITA